MMLPTHVVVGLAVATPLVVAAPEYTPAALTGAAIGSVLPDLDMYVGHRRSLHYPTAYAIAAALAVAGAAVLRTPLVVSVAFLLVAAALHCRMDRYGGGLELRPWEKTSERAVYDHVRGRWRTPKRWVRHDGAPEDVLLATLVGLPLLAVFDGPFRLVAGGAVLVAVVYGLLRRRLAALAPTVFGSLPERVATRVPDRYKE